MLTSEQISNTVALRESFEKRRARADAHEIGVLRDIAIKSSDYSEWYTLFAILTIEAMRPLYDTEWVSKRIDQLRAQMASR